MREIYTRDLEAFTNKLSEQATAVNDQVHQAINAFNQVDTQIAAKVSAEDVNVNRLANEIEKEAYRLIALQQPVAEDLRLIFSVINISSDLERMGDHAVSIAKNIERVDGEVEKVDSLAAIINEMAQFTLEMMDQVMTAFINRDKDQARIIAEKDEQLDANLKKLYKQSAARMENDRDIINSGINYLSIGNSLERIGDYVTNICERIIYLEDATIVDLNL